MKWPLILLSPRDTAGNAANQQLLSSMLAASDRLSRPGSLESFDLLFTDRLRELLECTQLMKWKVTLASPSLAKDDEDFCYAKLVELLGPSIANTMFCSQSGETYVVERCWRCEALCQGIVDKNGCNCCADEDESSLYLCDCADGDGFESPVRCPLHNMHHNHALRDEWEAQAPDYAFQGMPGQGGTATKAQHIKGLMGYK